MTLLRRRRRQAAGPVAFDRPQCRHCLRTLHRCPTCAGRYDTGLVCQACSFGWCCPACERHWTNP